MVRFYQEKAEAADAAGDRNVAGNYLWLAECTLELIRANTPASPDAVDPPTTIDNAPPVSDELTFDTDENR